MGWIGVDLDGTLAEYPSGDISKIGRPIPAMVARVKRWLSEGKEVRIMTARVAASGQVNYDNGISDTASFAAVQTVLIQEWCAVHIGQVLPVTATKDFAMTSLYDDRAIQVEFNTGRLIGAWYDE